MSAAVALSVAFHVFLIYGFSLAPHSGPGARVSAFHARLILTQPPRSPQQRKPTERIGAREEAPPAPTALPEPAAGDSAEPATAVPAAIAPIDPGPIDPGPIDPGPIDAGPIDAEPAAPAGGEVAAANIPDPVHYSAKDLDVYPQAAKRIAPLYPEMAHNAKVAGSVTLLVLIDEAGRVVDTSVTDATPEGVFEQAAQQALANAVFYPAQKEGRLVRSRVLIKIEFDPEMTRTAP
jgi:TonB family protein